MFDVNNITILLTSLTNKLILPKLSSTRNNCQRLPWVNQKLKRMLEKRTEFFRNIGNQVNLLIEKKFLDLKHLFRKSIKLTYQSNLENILDVASHDHTSKPNIKNSSHFLNIPNKIMPLLHLYANKSPSGWPHESHYSKRTLPVCV